MVAGMAEAQPSASAPAAAPAASAAVPASTTAAAPTAPPAAVPTPPVAPAGASASAPPADAQPAPVTDKPADAPAAGARGFASILDEAAPTAAAADAKPDAKPAVALELPYEAASGVSAEVHRGVVDFAQAHGLDATQAKALIAARAQESKSLVAQAAKGWVEALKADPHLGGANIKDTAAAVQKSIDTFARSKDEAAAIRANPYLSHPAIVGLLVNAAKAIPREDRTAVPGTAAPTASPVRIPDVLYPMFATR